MLYGLDGAIGKLVLVSIPDGLNVPLVINCSTPCPGVDVEIDQVVRTEGATGTQAPLALYDKEPINYYGTVVRGGYVRQPAVRNPRRPRRHIGRYGVTGRDMTVAVIDTGVDPHPALKPVLLPGYDFTRNREGGSERSDVNQSTMAILDGEPGFVNQSTMAILDQSTMAILDGPDYRGVRSRHDGRGRHSPDGAARPHPSAEGVQGRRLGIRLRRAARHLHRRRTRMRTSST